MLNKKLVMLIVVVQALALLFAACGNAETATTSSVPTTSVASPTTTSAAPTTTSPPPVITTTTATTTPPITETPTPVMAEITAVTPDSAEQGAKLEVTISGSGFTGATAVGFGAGVTVNSFNVVGDTEITANITIAADAVTGVRGISVTTPAGITTLTGGFTVAQRQPVLRTVIWTDSEFNHLSHILTGNVTFEYQLYFHAGNTMSVTSAANFEFALEVRDGKLCFLHVPQVAWDNIYSGAFPHVKYNSSTQVLTVDSLPDIILATMFHPAETSLPRIESMVTGEGKITITYYSIAIDSE